MDTISFCFIFCQLKILLPLISPSLEQLLLLFHCFYYFLPDAIDGITGGNISIANAYLADLSSDETRSKNFGKMAISSNLGFILGPAGWNLGEPSMEKYCRLPQALILSLATTNCDRPIKRIQAIVRRNISSWKKEPSEKFCTGM